MANNRRRLVGRVVSDKMEKTVVVSIERRRLHPLYKKVVKSTKKVMAHDETNAVPVGALVRIVESRPLSKHKRWVVEEVISETAIATVGALADEAVVIGEETEQ
ncbi:MAG: 30S ribosomal protein S17 [Chloroflexota bacterium]|nr:30S ribosomal protein S17 [Chloroflexota bacterium]